MNRIRLKFGRGIDVLVFFVCVCILWLIFINWDIPNDSGSTNIIWIVVTIIFSSINLVNRRNDRFEKNLELVYGVMDRIIDNKETLQNYNKNLDKNSVKEDKQRKGQVCVKFKTNYWKKKKSIVKVLMGNKYINIYNRCDEIFKQYTEFEMEENIDNKCIQCISQKSDKLICDLETALLKLC